MKFFIILFLVAIFCIVSVSASEISTNDTKLGTESQLAFTYYNVTDPLFYLDLMTMGNLRAVVQITSFFMDKVIKDAQESNANGQTQLSNEEVAFEYQKALLLVSANEGWGMVVGLFKMVFSVVLLILLMFEMRLILWVFVEQIPTQFLKLRDLIVMNLKKRMVR